jgi:Ca2+-binding EF-hand superfamily protein
MAGSLDIHEVYSYFSIDDNPFMVPIFNEVTRKHPKQVNTREFILCLWRFLTRDEPSMIEFMFQVFDTKRERGLRLKAFHDIIVYAYGREGADEKLTGILSKIPNRQDDALLSQEKIRYNLDQFRVAVRASPHIIQNALQLQVLSY